jgi:hypothetical protein
MKRQQKSPLQILWRLILVLTLITPAALVFDLKPARAGGWAPPFFGMIPATIKRNRVYKTANSFIKDKEQYYDALREKAAQQLIDRELTFGLRDNQVAAYIKVVALIEQERNAMYDFAETEKKAAHDQFIATAGDEFESFILSTTPATRVLGAMARGINSSQGFIDTALSNLGGGAGGFMAEVAKARRIAERMNIAGQLIGGRLGEALRKGSAQISKLTSPVDLVEADLIKVQEELGAFGGRIADLQDKGLKPVSSQTARDVAITLVTGEGDPAISLIADLLVAKHGGGGDFRDRAKDVMLGTGSARCAAKVAQIRRVLYKMEIDPAGEQENEPEIFPTCGVAEIPSLVEEIADVEAAVEEEESAAATTDSVESDQAADEAGDQAADPADSQPPDPEADSAQPETTSSSSEYIWVLTNTATNINNDQTAFYGGGSDPYWFPETRFEGKSAVFSCSSTSFSVHDVDVDYEYEYHNVTLSVNFDAPPAQLDPGQEVKLSASASGSGTVNEGGGNPGIALSYHYNNNRLEPALSYSPWAENFDGKSTESWSFTAPISATEGSEFTVSAGLWNVAPCHVIWTYQSQLNQNRIEGQEPGQETAQEATSPGPANSSEDARCADLRTQIASKVSIARGADPADLALGIIGYIQAKTGDVQIGYCEGGGAQVQKGIPIRIGDCIETGSSGLVRIVLNDRDDKYNADPTRFGMGSSSKMCFPNFAVHRDDGKPGLVELIQGAIRVITRGWQPDSGLGVNVGIRAAVTVASDIVLEYDPDLDLLHTYVNEGSVVVSNKTSGESQNLSDGELLITHQESIGSVEKMDNRVWKDLVAEQGLDLDENSLSDENPSSLLKRLNIPIAVGLIITGICGGGLLVLGVVAVIIIKSRKKKTEENQSDNKKHPTSD